MSLRPVCTRLLGSPSSNSRNRIRREQTVYRNIDQVQPSTLWSWRRLPFSVIGGAALMLCLAPANAQHLSGQTPLSSSPEPSARSTLTPGPTEADAPPQPPSPEAPTAFWERANLLGDMSGLRTLLGNYGISLGLQNTVELFGNVSGGFKRGASGDGLTQFGIGLDAQKAFGWDGAIFNVSGFWIYGPNFSQGYLGNLQTASSIVAAPTVRLWELWFQQSLLGGRADVKVGLQSLDQEFM